MTKIYIPNPKLIVANDYQQFTVEVYGFLDAIASLDWGYESK